MDIQKIASTGTAVAVLGTGTIVGGNYQIDKMQSIPNHAAVSVSVEIAKDKFPGLDKLVNAVLRNYLRKKNDYKLLEEDKKNRKFMEG